MRTVLLPFALFAALGLASHAAAAAPDTLTEGQKPLNPDLQPKPAGMSKGQKPLPATMAADSDASSEGQKPLNPALGKGTQDITPGQKPLGGQSAGSGAAISPHADHPLSATWGPAQLALTGLVQAQLAMYAGEDALLVNGAPAERVGLRLRRARLGLHAKLWDKLSVEVGFEASDDGAELLDANLSFAFIPELAIGAGFKKLPFSRFALISPGYQALSDRPLGTRAMAPLHQLGLTLSGDIANGALMYTVGAFNGFERNTNFHEGFQEPTATLGNRFTNMALGARLSSEPLGYLGPHMADLRTGSGKETFLLGIGASFYLNNGSTTTGLGVEGDVMLKFFGAHLLAEVVWDSSSPVSEPTTSSTIPADRERLSVTTELGYTYAFDSDPFHFGAVVRIELLDDAMAVEDSGDALAITGGLSFYWRRHHLKFNLEYTHRSEMNGQALDNDAIVLQLSSAL